MKITAPGIRMHLPPGWEAEIDGGAGDAPEGTETPRTPRVHIANFALPGVRGDFGSNAVERMIDGDAMICLLEEASTAAGSRLHQHQGIPTVRAEDFSPQAMQRALPGQSGTQYFFSDGDRAFVLYLAIGSHLSRAAIVPEINEVLAGIEFTD